MFSYIYIFAEHHFFGSACLHYFADITSFLNELLTQSTNKKALQKPFRWKIAGKIHTATAPRKKKKKKDYITVIKWN